MPRIERAADTSACWTASSELSLELPITSITFVTGIRSPPALSAPATVCPPLAREDSDAGADHAGCVAGGAGGAGWVRARPRQRPGGLRRRRLLPGRPHRRAVPGDARAARRGDGVGWPRPHR